MAEESARLDEANALEDARAEGFRDGVEYAKSYAAQLLLAKRVEAITAERQDAYDKAIAAIEALS